MIDAPHKNIPASSTYLRQSASFLCTPNNHGLSIPVLTLYHHRHELTAPATHDLTPLSHTSVTYDHTHWKTRDPVRSPIDKPVRGGLVVGSVTTSESPLLYVFFFTCRIFYRSKRLILRSKLTPLILSEFLQDFIIPSSLLARWSPLTLEPIIEPHLT